MIPCKLGTSSPTVPDPDPECNPDWDNMLYASHLDTDAVNLVEEFYAYTVDMGSAYNVTDTYKFPIGSLRLPTNCEFSISPNGGYQYKSITFWIKLDSIADGNFISVHDWAIGMHDGVVTWGSYDYSTIPGTQSITPGVWTYIQIENGYPTNFKVYVNGVLSSTVSYSSVWFVDIIFGKYMYNRWYKNNLSSHIDDLQVCSSNRAITVPTKPFGDFACA